jgi:hypothetical protein
VALLVAGSMGAGACGRDTGNRSGPGNAVGAAVSSQAAGPATTASRPGGTLSVPEQKLRETLEGLFDRHVKLVLATTGATARGDNAAATAARAELDRNSDDITGAIVAVYGPDAAVFGQGWKTHVQAFVDLAAAGPAHDAGTAAAARDKLDKYPNQVGGLLASVNPYLQKEAVAELVAAHIGDITGLIDAQVANQPRATDPKTIDDAAHHMAQLAAALSAAIARQFPDRFPG